MVKPVSTTNLLVLVGGGEKPAFPKNKAVIWDDASEKVVGEIILREEIRGLRVKLDRMLIVTEGKVFYYNTSDLKLLEFFQTAENSKGLCSINSGSKNNVYAFPDTEKGRIMVILTDENRTCSINAHVSDLGIFELNPDGTILATVSDKGNLIKIFNLASGLLVQNLRRGSEYANIHCLTFDPYSNWLSLMSDNGTMHVFHLTHEKTDEKESKNPRSNFAFMSFAISYFKHDLSFAQYRVHDVTSSVVFTKEADKLAIVGQEGDYQVVTMNLEHGGECILKEAKTLADGINQLNGW
eukprot:TRINITY_DN2672_c0_g1_i10.p1 TRINITY_DN2672_c0_g1~~TRINITY_DN2672_c0_g1_i10.p1  ORF type:complete len:296 (-),score=64.26 TRINITY_DN2672_c0_g1_i10:289-1176(-)